MQTLDLGCMKLGAAGMTALAGAAQHWPQLQNLFFSNNMMCDDGMKAPADAALHWPQLHTLDLFRNSLSDDGLKALADAACHWPQLQRLDLSANHKLRNEGVATLARHAAHLWPKMQRLIVESDYVRYRGLQNQLSDTAGNCWQWLDRCLQICRCPG
jgi:Ran GTPase-activating protein (RanGAP) involved in mRNA processing and transport